MNGMCVKSDDFGVGNFWYNRAEALWDRGKGGGERRGNRVR